jgi:heat shock protein HslJ
MKHGPHTLARIGLGGLALSLGLVACALPPAPPPRAIPATTGRDPLSGTSWSLATFVDAQGATQPALPGVEATLAFAGGRVGGTAGCNRLSGTYQVDGSSLTFGPIMSTMMACPEPQMTQEAAVTNAMANVASFEITGDRLAMNDASGATVLTFDRTQALSLVGREWTATMINNGRGGLASAVAGTTVTATFGEDGSLSGSGGCNSYSGTFAVDGNTISIGSIASTMMMCMGEGVMEQEQAYLAALSKATTYAIDGTTLDLWDADGARQVSYQTTR